MLGTGPRDGPAHAERHTCQARLLRPLIPYVMSPTEEELLVSASKLAALELRSSVAPTAAWESEPRRVTLCPAASPHGELLLARKDDSSLARDAKYGKNIAESVGVLAFSLSHPGTGGTGWGGQKTDGRTDGWTQGPPGSPERFSLVHVSALYYSVTKTWNLLKICCVSSPA